MRVKLFDIFEGLLERPIIQACLGDCEGVGSYGCRTGFDCVAIARQSWRRSTRCCCTRWVSVCVGHVAI